MYLYIFKNLPGLKGRCGVFGYFTPVSGIAETHAMPFLCTSNFITHVFARPHPLTNLWVGLIILHGAVFILLPLCLLLAVTSSVSVIVRSVTALAPNDTICLARETIAW